MSTFAPSQYAGIEQRRRTAFSHSNLKPFQTLFMGAFARVEKHHFQRRNAVHLAAIFLAFSGAFWYNFQMSNRIEIALENVSKNSAFGRLNSALESVSPAHPARGFDFVLHPLLLPLMRNCERAAATTTNSSGFGAAMRRNACAALLRQPGTHPRRLRSAAF